QCRHAPGALHSLAQVSRLSDYRLSLSELHATHTPRTSVARLARLISTEAPCGKAHDGSVPCKRRAIAAGSHHVHERHGADVHGNPRSSGSLPERGSPYTRPPAHRRDTHLL